MKRQQVISRFFAAKPAVTSSPSIPSSSSTEKPVVSLSPKPPSPPSVKPAAVSKNVDWPRKGRSSSSSRFSSQSRPSSQLSKKRSIGVASEQGTDEEEEFVESQPGRKRRSRLVQKSSTSSWRNRSDEVEDPVIQEPQAAAEDDDVDFSSLGIESDPEVLPTEENQSDDAEESDHAAGASFGSVLPQGRNDSHVEERFETIDEKGTPSLAAYLPQRLKTGPKRDVTAEIPPSDPIKRKLFVETLSARIDANGVVKKPWYGSPPTGKEKLTPLEAQVVELNAKYPDVMLMVEVGYRYRFFGDDAVTAGRVLGIFPHYDHNFLTASIPTFRLHFHVRRLVAAGLKVGVVRQTETAAIKAHGANKTGPFTRGLSALYTKATIEAAEDLGGREIEGKPAQLSSYLMCVAERPIQSAKTNSSSKNGKLAGSESTESERYVGSKHGSYDTEFGVVAVETATGDVMFGSFNDTVVRTELEGRLITCSPAELLLATPLSSTTDKLLRDFAGPASDVRVERVSRECFKDGGALAEVVDFHSAKGEYENDFATEAEEKLAENSLEVIMRMPDLVVQALALALRYLQQFNLEKVLRLGAVFRPFEGQEEMILSPNALRQLEILNNGTDGTVKGSLLWLMDHTETAFGARLLRYWVTHPLCDTTLIASRQDAVAEIANSFGSLGQAQSEGTFPGSGRGGGVAGTSRSLQHSSIGAILRILGRMPDLERGLTRIFHGTATPGEFVNVIQALITSAKHLQRLQVQEQDMDTATGSQLKSSLLQRLVSAVSSPSLCEHANHLLSAINTEAATAGDKLNLFHCKDGRFPEVVKCRLAIKAAEKELDEYLPGFRKLLRTPNLQYISINGLSHLVEAPAAQRVPANWMKINSTKKSTRYHPPEVLESKDKLALAQEQLAAASKMAWDMFLAEFSSHYVDFRASVQALAALDCLHSLAVLSRNQGYIRPEFVGRSETPQLMIQSGRHPILDSILQEAFVPNDTFLGDGKELCQIITGPNMGGKSCYIRQVALMVIMAQVGSYVPASYAKLHVFDSVQTRMGASDSLQKGSSTFFEELSETSTILRTATSRSLVILDELGRGTSTHDGVAIAYATLHYLLEETRCLTLFVTHYPKIAELKHEFPGLVHPYYVSYMAQEPEASEKLALGSSENVNDVPENSQTITFLYKLVPGVASRSFGLHVARLAQIPEACVVRAASMAAKFEKEVRNYNNSRGTMDYVEGETNKILLLENADRDTSSVCVGEEPNTGILSDGRDANSNGFEEEPNRGSVSGGRDVSGKFVDGLSQKRIRLGDVNVHGKSVDNFEELVTGGIDDGRVAQVNNQIVLGSVENSLDLCTRPTSSHPPCIVDEDENLVCTLVDHSAEESLSEDGLISRKENTKFLGDSELEGLVLSIKNALKYDNNPGKCMALLVDIQKQLRIKI